MDNRLADYQFDLPEASIAQQPSEHRESSRLMVLDRATGEIHHDRFSGLAEHLPPRSLIVVNDARVVPARLYGEKVNGGRVEVLILDPPPPGAGPGPYWLDCMVKPGRRLATGDQLMFGDRLHAENVRPSRNGRRIIRFDFERPPAEELEALGVMPLPPYIRRPDPVSEATRALDRERYQTVYARRPGAVAAPTAGLHFSRELLSALTAAGHEVAALTLLVGYGTFAPVREDDVTKHRLEPEHGIIPEETALAVNRAKDEGRPVVAVGTTVVRTLEQAGRETGRVAAWDGPCDLFIHPGHTFRVVDHLVTNFHLPGSSLILLVSALAGRERILSAYRQAVDAGYRFFSYGDAMFIR